MFRPDPEQTILGYIPVRFILSVLLVFAIVISVILILGIEREKNLVSELTREGAPPSTFFSLRTQGEIIKIAVVLFLLTAVGVSIFATYQSYHVTRRTLETVKSLARNILGSIPTGVITIDSTGRVKSANSAAEKTLLFDGDILGKRLMDVIPAKTGLGRLLDEAMTGGTCFHDKNVTYQANGQAVVLWVSLSELKDEKARREGMVLLLKDVSEVTRLGQQLRRSEKLSAINTLSAAVAHEIRNPLSAMDLNLGLLEEEVLSNTMGSSPAIREYMDVLNVEVKRLKEILDNFARFSKPTHLVYGEIRLESILQHLVSLIRGEAQEQGIVVQMDLSPSLPLLQADENQIMQVFLNIMINAIQAMPQGGKLQIRVEETTTEGRKWVDVKFSDTGIGIRSDKIEKIFEPFYSTRQGGTGLGLAVAHRIIEDHGGMIHVESVEGKGSAFTVRLPVQSVKEARESSWAT
jgi:signal transduction histidine kinase